MQLNAAFHKARCLLNTIKIKPSLLFKGRPGDPRLGEKVKTLTVKELTRSSTNILAILGAPDDLGVRLNRGRPGALRGPDAAREAFYKFAVPQSKEFSPFELVDVGNIPVGKQILKNHSMARKAAAAIASSGATMLALGGGHDYAAPHALGYFEGVSKAKNVKTFGVINIDPHLDVREFENNLPHSGTAFRQILESGMVKGRNLVQFGARIGRNAHKHFEFCRKAGVQVLDFHSLRRTQTVISKFQACLNSLAKRVDCIDISLDIDSCSDVEGASAAAVIGFSAWELCQMAYLAGKNKKVLIFEIAELAPGLDPSSRSARIAAEIIFHFSLGFSERKK
jgi:formimidoylglutamase